MPVPLLPRDIILVIIDAVAAHHPESLADCALTSPIWYPQSIYHLYRIFHSAEAPKFTRFEAIYAFANIVKKHPRLASTAVSLEIAPSLEPHLVASGSYIPFHHLSSIVLPNVRRLVLGKTLRWSDYPLLYRNGIVGFSFPGLTALDLSCHFNSLSDLMHTVQSFRNVKEVHLRYSQRDDLPDWMFNTAGILPSRNSRLLVPVAPFSKIQNLELPLAIWKPVVSICGDSLVNLSVHCPQICDLYAHIGDNQTVFTCPLTSLQRVKITVPVPLLPDATDSDNNWNNTYLNYAELRHLNPLLIHSIIKPGVLFFLSTYCVQASGSPGHHVIACDTTATELQEIIQDCADSTRALRRQHSRIRRALLVSVGYSPQVLREDKFHRQTLARVAHRDTMNLSRLLTKRYDYKREDITILVDSEDAPPECQPTRLNVTSAMKKLIMGKQAGDHIMFSFSGHRCQIDAREKLQVVESDDENHELLVPKDYASASCLPWEHYYVDIGIERYEIRDIFVNNLAPGVHCSLIFDHFQLERSGNTCDLPYVLDITPQDTPYFSKSPTSPHAQGSFASTNTLHDNHVDGLILGGGPSLYPDRDVTWWSAYVDKDSEMTLGGRTSDGIFLKAFMKTLDANPDPNHKDLLKELKKSMLRVTEEENEKLQTRWQRGVQPGSPQRRSKPEELYVAPRPQLGSLRPTDSILLDIFTL